MSGSSTDLKPMSVNEAIAMLPKSIVEAEFPNLKKKDDEQEGEDRLMCIFKEFLKCQTNEEKNDFLENHDLNDVMAIREIYIKRYFITCHVLMDNIKLISDFVYKI